MLTGRCQCGAVRYRAGTAPLSVYCCHCTECRKQSSAAFGISVIVPTGSVELTKGQVKIWSRPTSSGKVMDCAFCPDCGSRLWHVNNPAEDEVSIKGGSLDEPVDLTGAAHIWTSSSLPGVAIPQNAPNWPGEPD